MRRVGSVLIVGGTLLLGAAGVAQAASTMVEAQDFDFSPKTISIDPGNSITFTNTGNATHTATADNGSFDTGDIKPGASETITIKAPGTYPFYCKYHGGPGGVGMSGTITVGKGGPTKGAPQTATPLPIIAAAGAVLLGLGLLLTRRRTRTG
jgi:LPXTG-motif cell wall-anchored protein